MYIVYQDGVYRHNILGVFTTIELAKKCAILGALDEYDGYHRFCVAEIKVDIPKSGDAVEDLFYVSSESHVWGKRDQSDPYDLRPISRKICTYNNDSKVIEVLLEMSKDLEVRK